MGKLTAAETIVKQVKESRLVNGRNKYLKKMPIDQLFKLGRLCKSNFTYREIHNSVQHELLQRLKDCNQ